MSGVKLERTLDQWRSCSAEAMATKLSPTAIAFAIADAKHDIETLANEIDTLRTANQRLELAAQVSAQDANDAERKCQRLEGEVRALREALGQCLETMEIFRITGQVYLNGKAALAGDGGDENAS